MLTAAVGTPRTLGTQKGYGVLMRGQRTKAEDRAEERAEDR